jgi:hypothetical protein
MAVVTHLYDAIIHGYLTKANSWTGDSMKVALFSASTFTHGDSAYTTSGTEVSSGNGYTTGGLAIATTTISAATVATQLCKITSADGGGASGTATWTATGAGFTAVACKIYVVSGSPVCNVDFGGSQTASGGGTFVITWDATNGVFNAASS